MKTNVLKTTVFVLAALVLSFAACKKDKDKTTEPASTSITAKDFFEVTGATYFDGAMPSSSSSGPVLDNVIGNASIIDGGSNILKVHTTSNIDKILIAKKGNSGYYTLEVDEASKDLYQFVLIFNSELPEDEFTIVVAIMDANGLVSNYFEIIVKKIENVGAGILQFSMSFDLLNDIDLHVQQPNGTEIYYNNRGGYDYSSLMHDAENQLTPEQYEHLMTLEDENEMYAYLSQYFNLEDYKIPGGWLDIDSNAACRIDSVNNENINYNYASDIEAGEYIVRVDFWSDCVGGNLNTNYVVTAKYNGQIISGNAVTGGQNPYNGSFEPGTDDSGGLGSGVEVMRINISPAALKAAVDNNTVSYEFFYGKKTIQKTLNISEVPFQLHQWLKKAK